MPTIIIKDYTWRQTSDFVILNIPLRGHPKKVDLFVIDNYMKVSFPPFIVELFLWSNVEEKDSKCTITDEEAIVSLRKINLNLEWPMLQMENIDDEFKRDCRKQALENVQKLAEETTKLKSEKRNRLQKEAVREQIDVNTTTLNKIDAIRNSHRMEAMRDFDDWRSKAELPFLPNVEGSMQENRKAYKPPLKLMNNKDNEKLESKERIGSVEFDKKEDEAGINDKTTEKNVETRETERKDLSSDNDDQLSSSESSESDQDQSWCRSMDQTDVKKSSEKMKQDRPGLQAVKAAIKGNFWKKSDIFDEQSKSIPLPRKNATINVTFSERKFPTPARESSRVKEQEWLEKQAEARRKVGFDAEDLRPEERDPQWLKDKGDEFFKVGNYLAAISAYSYGIKISDKMSALYVNRSAAHYAQGNYYRCVEDCTKALELMEPKCEGNRESRARCYARRGAALCKLSAPQHGIPELEAALELTPDNESIKRDVVAAKQYFNIKD